VQWKHFSPEEATWELEEDMLHVTSSKIRKINSMLNFEINFVFGKFGFGNYFPFMEN
jgi:hypothetical protein